MGADATPRLQRADLVHVLRRAAAAAVAGGQKITLELDEAVNAVLDERLAHPTESADLLNVLFRADNGTWPRKRVRDEALTFMLAGHETTANAMSWLWYLLARNPDARDRMLAEIDDVLGGRRPTADDLTRLPWTTACVQESQRYFSAVWIIAREAVEDDVIDGHHIRPGTTVLIPIHHIHHDERWWPDPETFDPTRFIGDAVKDRPRSAYLPFGGGRRICIGQSFALMEMVLMAAVMSQRFTFDVCPDHPVELEATLTLRPKHGLHVVAHDGKIRGRRSTDDEDSARLRHRHRRRRLLRHRHRHQARQVGTEQLPGDRGRRRTGRHLVLEHVSRYRR